MASGRIVFKRAQPGGRTVQSRRGLGLDACNENIIKETPHALFPA